MPQSFRCNWAAPVRMTLAFAALALFAPMLLRAAVPDPRCITVKGVVIVSGSEAWADKKLCKSPGSARYDVIEVAQTVYGAASTTAAFEKAADPELRALRSQIEALRSQVASGGDEANPARLALLAAQGKFVTGLAARDRGYAQALEQFRALVVDVAASPEGVAALAQFNAGDEAGALAILDRLRAANEAARQMQSNIASAVEGRRIAGLALDARNKGKLTTAQVIARYEDVTRLDPGVFADCIELARLYMDAGRLSDAARSVAAGRKVVASMRDLAVADITEGDILRLQGDITGAEKAYFESLTISRKIVVAAPNNVVAQYDLSDGLMSTGEIRMLHGDLEGAGTAYAEGLSIRRKLAASHPDNAMAQSYVSTSLVELGDSRWHHGFGLRKDRLGKWQVLQYDNSGADAAYLESLESDSKLSGVIS